MKSNHPSSLKIDKEPSKVDKAIPSASNSTQTA